MAKPSVNPLDAFVSVTPVSNNFRLPPHPKLSDHTDANGFKEGIRSYDDAVLAWISNLEKTINERVVGKTQVSQGQSK